MNIEKDELNRIRQWFDAVDDLNPAYLEAADRDLMSKIMAALGMTEQWQRSERLRNQRIPVLKLNTVEEPPSDLVIDWNRSSIIPTPLPDAGEALHASAYIDGRKLEWSGKLEFAAGDSLSISVDTAAGTLSVVKNPTD
jgi:hypothetical protein